MTIYDRMGKGRSGKDGKGETSRIGKGRPGHDKKGLAAKGYGRSGRDKTQKDRPTQDRPGLERKRQAWIGWRNRGLGRSERRGKGEIRQSRKGLQWTEKGHDKK